MLPLLVTFATLPPPQFIDLGQGMRITRSSTVNRQVYSLPSGADDGKSAAITIEGNGITVDFAGATLQGTPQRTPPNERKGTGVLVKGNNITIRNLNVRGYRHGLIAVDCDNLRILDSDFSYNWKQKLNSTLDREDASDWMSFHHNEKDEWLRFGQGIYLKNCENFEVRGCSAKGGQSGLMVTNSNKGKIWNNDFSFLSAIGVGLYRSSENVIMHNKIDWCVRGFSYGVYNRGQDSAGILVYEQSNRNVFAYNSVTHGGDGFFLWAGQTTMDTGEGGCNDNLVFGNDFSHAPTNGIEATFSRNKFVNNLLMECWHGIWGGYSYDSEVLGNVFAYNEEAIAWEHGQNNRIAGNRFYRNAEDLVIWSNPTQDPNWGYPKHRDTRSRDWSIRENLFEHSFARVLRLSRSNGAVFERNFVGNAGSLFRIGDAVEGWAMRDNTLRALAGEPTLGNDSQFGAEFAPKPKATSLSPGYVDDAEYIARFQTKPGNDIRSLYWDPMPTRIGDGRSHGLERDLREGSHNIAIGYAPEPLRGGNRPFLPEGAPRGWRYILVDEWGPYDFLSPKLWPREKRADGARRFEILGPQGEWKALTVRGAKLSAESGKVPGFVDVTMSSGVATDLFLDFEYRGSKVTTPFGVDVPAGNAYRFQYREFFAPIAWEVQWFPYNKETQGPRTMQSEFAQIFQSAKPIKTETTDRLDYAWGGAIGEGLPSDYFATLAEGTFEVPAGNYRLNVTSDDGVRVFVDGKKVIENWTWHGPTLDTADLQLLSGKHRIRVEHFEIDGYATLKVALVPRS